MLKALRRFPYWYLLAVPALLFILGAASNQAVLVANHGKFPVMVNDAEIAKLCPSADELRPEFKGIACTSDGHGGQYLDRAHTIMGPNSHLKMLADIFDLGDGTYSIGDFLIMLGTGLWSFTPIMWLTLILRKLYNQV